MPKVDYSKDIFKQLQELMIKCDNLSYEVKNIEKRPRKNLKTNKNGEEKFIEVQLEKYLKRYDEIIEESYVENKKIKKKYLRQEEQKLLNRINWVYSIAGLNSNKI